MPLLSPKDNPALEVLSSVGLLSRRPSEKEGKKRSVSEVLEENGLSMDELVHELKQDLRSENEAIHHNAVKLGFQMHGALKEAERPTVPEINLIINGNEQTNVLAILTPRS